MIDEQALADWANAIVHATINGDPFVPGPRDVEFKEGDFTGTVSITLGPGLTREGLWDTQGFQVKLSGRERDRARIRTAVGLVDRAIIELDVPGSYWGVWVTSAGRFGSGPSTLPPIEDLRITYVCTYFAEVAA